MNFQKNGGLSNQKINFSLIFGLVGSQDDVLGNQTGGPLPDRP
jgi:hypothetical protein